MRLDLFSKEDSILLLGEGNFSFAVNLLKSKVAGNIIATCFEKEIFYQQQVENINYLKSENVKVLFDVDATKLHENEKFFGKNFSKIIFNFPHVGGKMKIHLNRDLLKNFFISASQLIKENGKIIVSLCKGQGGIPLDKPQRRWDDTWQVTEMAAYGNFVLVDVEPFYKRNFPTYYCVGYRSQDVQFNLDGTLVYIFGKKKNLYEDIIDSTLIQSKGLAFLTNNPNIFVPIIYADLYKNNNPLLNQKSCVSYFKNLIIEHFKIFFPNCSLKFYSDMDIPLFVKKNIGVKCEVNSNDMDFKLRFSVFDILSVILKSNYFDKQNEIIFFPGVYFLSPVGVNLFGQPPIKIQFLILAKNLEQTLFIFFQNLCKIFEENTYNIQIKKKELIGKESIFENFEIQSKFKIIYKNEEGKKSITLANVYNLQYCENNIECSIIKTENLCNSFFRTTCWKQIWSEGNKVLIDFKKIPVLKQPILFPRSYKLDITLRYEEGKNLENEKVYETLWLVAGQIIENVEMLTQYTSNKGWSSKSFRITYKSLDKPLCRSKIIDVQSKIIGPFLENILNVTVG